MNTSEAETYIGYGMDRAVRRQVIDSKIFHFEQRVCLNVRHHYATAFLLFPAFTLRSGRKRGSAISSIPKLMSDRPAPRMAIQAPGGINHHHSPPPNAPACCAQYSMLRQLGIVPSPRPRNSSAPQVSTTKMVELTNPAPPTPTSLAKTSKNTLPHASC